MQLSLKINATFAENKCNFLALLLQQKLALVIIHFTLITYRTENWRTNIHIDLDRYGFFGPISMFFIAQATVEKHNSAFFLQYVGHSQPSQHHS